MPAPELRLVLAVSLDGRLAPAAGGAAQLGGRGDRRVLEEALAWADAVLIGARTLRLHGTTCLIRDPDLLELRRAQERPEQPPALVVSRSGRFDPAMPFFRQPLVRWLLCPAPLPQAPAGFAVLQRLQGRWEQDLEALAVAGLQRLVLLGGAELAATLLAQQQVDALQLTLCPQLLGGAHTWMPLNTVLSPSRWQLLEQRPLEGNELVVHYRRLRD